MVEEDRPLVEPFHSMGQEAEGEELYLFDVPMAICNIDRPREEEEEMFPMPTVE